MGGNKERQRILDRIVKGDGNLGQHSLNQRALKYERDRGKKGFGRMDKAVKEEKRRREEQQLLEDQQFGMQLLGSRLKMQFYRALTKMADGGESDEDIKYVYSNIDKYEHTMERFKIRKFRSGREINVTEVVTTIVNLTPPNSKNSS